MYCVAIRCTFTGPQTVLTNTRLEPNLLQAVVLQSAYGIRYMVDVQVDRAFLEKNIRKASMVHFKKKELLVGDVYSD